MSAGVIRRVAVIGAGRLAVRFVERCLGYGVQVYLEDVLPAHLRSASAALEPAVAVAGKGAVTIMQTVEDAVRDADLAIDFVPDELESKLEILSMVDRMAPPRTVLCTPTEALSISDLASCTYRPERCLALHGFREALQSEGTWFGEVRLSYPSAADEAIRSAVEVFLSGLGMTVVSEPDLMESQLTRLR